jgi:hypothetical protein
MNIDDLTLGQLKTIAAMFTSEKTSTLESPMIGKYVLIRCYSAGVHAGELVSQVGDVVVLKNSRRLWSWGSPGGVALSGVAQLGLVDNKKVDTLNPLIQLTGAIETILCSDILKIQLMATNNIAGSGSGSGSGDGDGDGDGYGYGSGDGSGDGDGSGSGSGYGSGDGYGDGDGSGDG